MTAPTTVGVVVCAYTERRWDLLVRAIDSVRADQRADAIVAVIDHNDDLLTRCREQWDDIDVIENAHERGLSGARNTGVAHLTSDVIAFLDDDAVATPGWLTALTAPFDDPGIGLSAGRVVPEWALGEPGWFPPEFLWVVGSSYEGLPTEATDIRNPIGASMAVRRTVFEDVGLFYDGVGRVGTIPLGCEETELAIRAGKAGHRVRYAPASVVEHHVSDDRHEFAYFARRCRAEGQSKAIVSKIAGAEDSLSSERSYVARTIPLAARRELLALVRGPGRAAALGRLGALGAGCLITAVGYAIARVRMVVQPSRRVRVPDTRPLPPRA